MCSLFKLFQNCEKKLNDYSLETIDAILGCGLIMFQKSFEISVKILAVMIEHVRNAIGFDRNSRI
jgi:hypothetical protein